MFVQHCILEASETQRLAFLGFGQWCSPLWRSRWFFGWPAVFVAQFQLCNNFMHGILSVWLWAQFEGFLAFLPEGLASLFLFTDLFFFFFFFNFQLFSASFVLVCLFSLFSRFGGIYGNCACCYFSLLSFDLTSILRLIAFIFIKHDGQYAAPVSFLLLPAFGLTSLATLIPRVWFETVTGCSGATWFCWGWMG